MKILEGHCFQDQISNNQGDKKVMGETPIVIA
jgi:hypothetical protein